MEDLQHARSWLIEHHAPEWIKDDIDYLLGETQHLWTHLSTEHALLTKHLDAEGYSGMFPDTCEVCRLLMELAP